MRTRTVRASRGILTSFRIDDTTRLIATVGATGTHSKLSHVFVANDVALANALPIVASTVRIINAKTKTAVDNTAKIGHVFGMTGAATDFDGLALRGNVTLNTANIGNNNNNLNTKNTLFARFSAIRVGGIQFHGGAIQNNSSAKATNQKNGNNGLNVNNSGNDTKNDNNNFSNDLNKTNKTNKLGNFRTGHSHQNNSNNQKNGNNFNANNNTNNNNNNNRGIFFLFNSVPNGNNANNTKNGNNFNNNDNNNNNNNNNSSDALSSMFNNGNNAEKGTKDFTNGNTAKTGNLSNKPSPSIFNNTNNTNKHNNNKTKLNNTLFTHGDAIAVHGDLFRNGHIANNIKTTGKSTLNAGVFGLRDAVHMRGGRFIPPAPTDIFSDKRGTEIVSVIPRIDVATMTPAIRRNDVTRFALSLSRPAPTGNLAVGFRIRNSTATTNGTGTSRALRANSFDVPNKRHDFALDNAVLSSILPRLDRALILHLLPNDNCQMNSRDLTSARVRSGSLIFVNNANNGSVLGNATTVRRVGNGNNGSAVSNGNNDSFVFNSTNSSHVL